MANPILDESDFQRIQNGITQAEEAQRIIDMAKQAGLDVAQFEAQAKKSRDQLLKIKNTFFPGR